MEKVVCSWHKKADPNLHYPRYRKEEIKKTKRGLVPSNLAPCLSYLACCCASSTSHHFCKCKDNGNCKSLLRIQLAVNSWKGWKLGMKFKARRVVKSIYKHTDIILCVKTVRKELLSFSTVCRCRGVTPRNASLKRMRGVWIILLFLSMLHKPDVLLFWAL